MPRRTDDSAHIGEYRLVDHKIMAMEEEKREQIIGAALEEFAKGYTLANTDAIVQQAGISKGLLFHYFGSKRGLFLFLVKYALSTVLDTYSRCLAPDKDFLENLRLLSQIKSEGASRHPQAFSFMIKALPMLANVFPEGLPEDLPFPATMWMREIWQQSNNDPALFKEGVNPDHARDIIIWTVNGLSDSLLRYGDDPEAYRAHYQEMAKEIADFYDTLRQLFYR